MGRAGGGQGRAWPLRAEVQGRFPLLQDPSLGAPVPSSGGSPARVPRSSLLICHDKLGWEKQPPRDGCSPHLPCPNLQWPPVPYGARGRGGSRGDLLPLLCRLTRVSE